MVVGMGSEVHNLGLEVHILLVGDSLVHPDIALDIGFEDMVFGHMTV